MKIQVLRNFGHRGSDLSRGTILEVDPEEFGGTYQDFLSGGFLVELPADEAASADAPAKGRKGA